MLIAWISQVRSAGMLHGAVPVSVTEIRLRITGIVSELSAGSVPMSEISGVIE